MTAFMPPLLQVQPRVQDIQQGRPHRVVAIPLPSGVLNRPLYELQFTQDDSYGSQVLFVFPDEPMPAFDLTGAMTSQLGTLLVAGGPCGFDNTGGTTAVGYWRAIATGTDPGTTETEQVLVGHGPVLVRLNTTLTRTDRILLGNASCGCAGGAVCGCGNGTGCATCDHPLPPTDPDYCNVLTKRAMTKGRWRGPYSDLDPPDQLGPYIRWDVVSMPDGSEYAYVGPADGVTPCWAPGQTTGPLPHS